MNYIKEWIDFNQSVNDKIISIVDKILSHQSGGEDFFNKMDDAIKDPKNKDITIGLFNKIYSKYGHNFNLAISGSYGRYILELKEKGDIQCNGTIVLFNGSITSHKNLMGTVLKNKDVNIEYKSSDIESKKFIFVDDSYYSGTTFKLILNFLRKKGCDIITTYVIYDGNDTKSQKRISLYNYYDYHKGRNLTVEDLIDKLDRIKDAPIDIIKPFIEMVNKQWNKMGINKYLDPKRFNFSNPL